MNLANGFSFAFSGSLINYLFRNITYTPSTIWAALCVSPTNKLSILKSNKVTYNFTEVSGNGYARRAFPGNGKDSLNNSSPNYPLPPWTITKNTSASTIIVKNTYQLNFPPSTGTWGEASYVVGTTSGTTGGGVELFFTTVPGSPTVISGQSISIPAGGISMLKHPFFDRMDLDYAEDFYNFVFNKQYFSPPQGNLMFSISFNDTEAEQGWGFQRYLIDSGKFETPSPEPADGKYTSSLNEDAYYLTTSACVLVDISSASNLIDFEMPVIQSNYSSLGTDYIKVFNARKSSGINYITGLDDSYYEYMYDPYYFKPGDSLRGSFAYVRIYNIEDITDTDDRVYY